MLTDVYCTTCTHAIFNESWGEWRCGKRGVTIHNLLDASFCKSYTNKNITPNEARRKMGLREIGEG